MMTLLRIFGSVHVSFKSLQTQSKPLLEKKGKKQDENLIRYPYKKNQNTIIVVTLLHELEHHKFHYEHQNFEYPPQNHPLQRTSKNKKTKHYYLQFTWLERFISYYFILSLSLCLSLSLLFSMEFKYVYCFVVVLLFFQKIVSCKSDMDSSIDYKSLHCFIVTSFFL